MLGPIHYSNSLIPPGTCTIMVLTYSGLYKCGELRQTWRDMGKVLGLPTSSCISLGRCVGRQAGVIDSHTQGVAEDTGQ